jgi:organic radical activating enzyme
MKKVIKIHYNNPNILKITFLLTTACPYTCRYCPAELHNGKNQHIDLEQVAQLFDKFKHRQILLILTGGEVTLHPQFKDVVELAKQMGVRVAVDTNSVRTVRFYKEVTDLVDVWNITLHPSQHTFDIEKITVLTDKAYVVVYIMMDPLHWDLAVEWYTRVSKLDNVKIIPLRAVSNWGGAVCQVDYTPEQQIWLVDNPDLITITPARRAELEQTHAYFANNTSTVTWNDNSSEILDPYMLIKINQNRFYGWNCSAGNENIFIQPDHSAGWATCGIKSYNHFNDIDPTELAESLTCNRLECNCVTDIRSTKSLVR